MLMSTTPPIAVLFLAAVEGNLFRSPLGKYRSKDTREDLPFHETKRIDNLLSTTQRQENPSGERES